MSPCQIKSKGITKLIVDISYQCQVEPLTTIDSAVVVAAAVAREASSTVLVGPTPRSDCFKFQVELTLLSDFLTRAKALLLSDPSVKPSCVPLKGDQRLMVVLTSLELPF